MQKTDFDFEVLVHDDASTDDTPQIIAEYQKKYPKIIKPIFQKENQYSKGIKPFGSCIYPMAKGRYIALCEGDDFWTDPHKLQKQVDALEANTSCSMCVSRVRGVSEDGNSTIMLYPSMEIESGVIESRAFIELVCHEYSFQTSCYFFRREGLWQYLNPIPQFRKVADVGDEPYLLFFGQLGNVFYINDIMSCYRMNSVGSWTQRNRNTDKKICHVMSMIHMMKEFDKYTKGRYQEICAKRITNFEFAHHYLKEEYKSLLEKKYRKVLKTQVLPVRVKIHLCAYFPQLGKKFFQLYGNLKSVMKRNISET